MMTDKVIEELLDRYFKGEMTPEEKVSLFESIKLNPSLDDTIQEVLRNCNPAEVEKFISEKALMSDTIPMSEEDESMIELYFSGMMEPGEEEAFKTRLLSDEDFRSNALAQAFLYKAIQKIKKSDEDAIESAKELSESSIRTLFAELKEEDDDELIDSFLSGRLSDSEETQFKQRLQADPKFRERASAIAMLSKGIHCELKQAQKAIEDARKLTPDDIKKELSKTIPLWPKIRRWAWIAAATVVVAGCGVDYYRANSYISDGTMAFAAQNAELAYSSLPEDIHSRGGDADLNKLFENVRTKQNLKETIKELESELESGICEDQKRLMLATAYIYNGQKADAKKILKNLVADELSEQEFKDKAQKLLNSLNNSIIF